MSRRKAALQALELLSNAVDTQSVASDDDDNDYEDNDDFDNDFEDEMETTNQPNAEYDSDEDSDNEETEETNIDKTSKNGTIWIRLKDGEETSLRKKINFNEKVGPTSYATRQINETKLSAFIRIFDLSMINVILNCTNCHAKAADLQVSFTKEDILAFIGLLYYLFTCLRLASTEIDSSGKKRCQIRLCNGNKSNFNCDKCKQFTCGPCLGGNVFKSICKNCYDQGLGI